VGTNICSRLDVRDNGGVTGSAPGQYASEKIAFYAVGVIHQPVVGSPSLVNFQSRSHTAIRPGNLRRLNSYGLSQ
jgi:hypothetical protein